MYALEESFRILRVTMEARSQGPTMIAVSSALPDDGSTYVACGIARAFAEAGHRTLLVGANSRVSVAEEVGFSAGVRATRSALGFVSQVEDAPGLHVASVETGATGRAKSVASLLNDAKGEFEALVVALDPVAASGLALEIASNADDVLLAVRMGRNPAKADRELLRLLSDRGTRIAGVVPTRSRRRPTVTERPAAQLFDSVPRYQRKAKAAS